MTITIITGGQTGVDTGALLAAKECGVQRSAVLPKGRRREAPVPEWMADNVEELSAGGYSARTREVVRRADAVLVIARKGPITPGTLLTIQLAATAGKQLWKWEQGDHHVPLQCWVEQLLRWHRSQPLTMMVAGPRESKWPQAEAYGHAVLTDLLTRLAR